MRLTQAASNDAQTILSIMRGGVGAASSRPALAGKPRIHDLVDQVVERKHARDTADSMRSQRLCGCPRCRSAYLATLIFYAELGSDQPARERIRPIGLAWYDARPGPSSPGWG